MSAYAAENRLRKWFTGDVHTKKIQQATSKKWDDHIALLFTGNVPRGVLCERRSQKTRDIPREFMRSA